MHLDRGRPGRSTAPWWLYAVVAVVTAAVLVVTGESQIYDTNFQSTWEAVNLLAGDHPYRDFFEWGMPLQVLVSAAAQKIGGYRIASEFAVQWAFMVAAVLVAFHLALRLSGSIGATLVTMALAIALLSRTPTFHYPKLFFYPLALWLAWRYLDRPGRRGAALLGAVTAASFLYRHDHGVYIGGITLLAMGVAYARSGPARRPRELLRHVAACALGTAVLVGPWMVLVQTSEGLPAYVRSRAQLYALWSSPESPYRTLMVIRPLRLIRDGAPLTAKAGLVRLHWLAHVDEGRQRELEARYRLRRVGGPDAIGRYQYEAADIYDPALWQMRGDLDNADSETEGLDWNAIERAQAPFLLPSNETAMTWLEQVTLLVPMLLVLLGLLRAWRFHGPGPRPTEVHMFVLGGLLLSVVCWRILREPSYLLAVAPTTAALAAPLLRPSLVTARAGTLATVLRVAHRVMATAICLLTVLAVVALVKSTRLAEPIVAVRQMPALWRILTNVPPIEGTISSADLGRYTRQAWNAGESRNDLLLRYVHDCTAAGDRVGVAGSTPYQVGYLVERPVAGGHVWWRYGWRSDPVRERESLALLQRQSVPFVLSTHTSVLDEFREYPRILEYLRRNYVALEGSQGQLLIDRRRRPTGTFAALGFPCFS